jgi:hypothetical protein
MASVLCGPEGHTAIASLLIESETGVNVLIRGLTRYIIAARSGKDVAVGVLLNAGADREARDDQRRTALESIEEYLHALAVLNGQEQAGQAGPGRNKVFGLEDKIRSEILQPRTDRFIEDFLKAFGAEGEEFWVDLAKDFVQAPPEEQQIKGGWTPVQLAGAAGRADISGSCSIMARRLKRMRCMSPPNMIVRKWSIYSSNEALT